jgi:hypothetical protein
MRSARILGALLLLAAGAGCGGHAAPEVRADPSAYFVHGYYLGSKANVKVFLEDVSFSEEMKGTLSVELVILDERTEAVKFLSQENWLVIGGRRLQALESQGLIVRPGELQRATITFRTDQEEFARGTLEISGVEIELGTRLHFNVPLYAVDPDAPEPRPSQAGGYKRH